MIDDIRKTTARDTPARDAGPLLLAAGGLAAAFGAASCCAFPLLFGSLGVSSAWLVTVAWFAAPHRIALLAIAVACLAAGGVLLRRRRRVVGCESKACRSPVMTTIVACVLSVGAVLVVLGWIYA